MARSVYIAAMGPGSGKSVVSLGLMDLLFRRIGKVGFFRPVVATRAGGRPDNDIELIRRRYQLETPYEQMYATTAEEAQARIGAGEYEDLLKDIVQAYRRVAATCDFVLCEGTDFTGASSALEFELNARIAEHLGAPVVAVVSASGMTLPEGESAVQAARKSLATHGLTLAATIVNRVAPEQRDSAAARARQVAGGDGQEPIYVLPEVPDLAYPTVGEVAEGLSAKWLHGEPVDASRTVRQVKLAAMSVPHFLERLVESSLVVTPGDRDDIVVACVAAAGSDAYPSIAGVVLVGGLGESSEVRKLFSGSRRPPFPLLSVETDSYVTATLVSHVESVIGPDDERKVASALGAFERHVDVEELADRISVVRSDRVTPIMFEYELVERATADRRHVVLPEGTDDRVLQAAEILRRRDVVDLTVLGDEAAVRARAAALGLALPGVRVVDPATSDLREDFAATYHDLRRHKGVGLEQARDLMVDVSYFGTMMVFKGLVDGMVSGAAHSTGHTIRPALEFIRTKPGVNVVSSVFFMCLEDRVLVYGDCAVVPNPTVMQLADIAISSADTAAAFGITPRVAMLSYSTGESGAGADVDNVREATKLVRYRRPDLKVEGPIQYDAAIDASVARSKLPGSEVAGQATVFVFPDLNTGNNTYKAVQRSAHAVAIGPVLQGLRRPVNDLSRGCTVTDIVNTVAITAVQAQQVATASS